MDEFDLLQGMGNGSAQDSFDLAALQYFRELDRGGEKAPAEAPAAPRPLPFDDEDPGPDLTDCGADGAILAMMAEPLPGEKAPAPGKLTRPVPPRKTGELSREARRVGEAFDRLSREDRALVQKLLARLEKA